MGIHGIFKEIGPGQRISLAKVASNHYALHERPFRLAIDISIWLFQIQSGKGGSNPALRTFYYRLLRLLNLNIHPLFVFDGPNKPLFKRNKRVGGPGVRVATVPEFLAKQLLKQFGFPIHVAPGEAEAECALLQREGIVDAVLSEDVDTLMFGSKMTLRNWSAENSQKSPTHVNVYHADQTQSKSGLDSEGMILVALLSGGDYIVEGIPGCGPKLACEAARAGFGKGLCAAFRTKKASETKSWREGFQHQLKTNEAKHFSRKHPSLVLPDDFPNREVLGYYTRPCISTPDKLARLKESLAWDNPIDFAALRMFTGDAFDWRCLSGAQKFIKNLAPAMLVRELRLRGDNTEQLSEEAQEGREKELIQSIHGKRNHATTDGELEYRISFTPVSLVPIDLSVEPEDDELLIADGEDEQSDFENEFSTVPNSTQEIEDPVSALQSPKKKRNFRPFDPSAPDKLWIMRNFLHIGCPLLVEQYESSLKPPGGVFKTGGRAKPTGSQKPASGKRKANDMPKNALMPYTRVTKPTTNGASGPKLPERQPLETLSTAANRTQPAKNLEFSKDKADLTESISTFRLPSTQIPVQPESRATQSPPKVTPLRKRPETQDILPPTASQRTIDSYWSPSPQKDASSQRQIIDLISSPREALTPRACTPTPTESAPVSMQRSETVPDAELDWSPGKLPDTVTKRRKKTPPLRRFSSVPIPGRDEPLDFVAELPDRPATPNGHDPNVVEIVDLASPLSAKSLSSPASPTCFRSASRLRRGDKGAADELPDERVAPSAQARSLALSSDAEAEASTRAEEPNAQFPPRVAQRVPKHRREKKTLIQIRESLPGAWKEVDIEAVDMSGDGSGWKQSQRIASVAGWRKSGVEVLDLTGA